MFLQWKPPDFLSRSSHITSSFLQHHSIYQTIDSLITSLSKHTSSHLKNLQKLLSSVPNDLIPHSPFLRTFHDTLSNTISIYDSWLRKLSNYNASLYDTQTKKYTDFQQGVLSLEKTILSESTFVEKAKNAFHLSAKKTESALYEMEMKKKRNLFNNDNNEIIKSKRNIDNLMKITKENENIYLNKLTSLQVKMNQYEEAIHQYIMNTKALEINVNYHIKNILSFYYNQTILLYGNLQTNMKYGLEMVSNLMKELITVTPSKEDNDKGNMNEGNKLEIKIENLQYEPYEISFMNNHDDIDENVFMNIVSTLRSSLKEVKSNFLSNTTHKESNRNNITSSNNELNFINLLTIAIHHGECMNKVERRQLYTYIIQERKYRKKFLFTLNIQRSHGLLKLNYKKFHICVKVFYLILNSIKQENDYELFKFLLILSQTFYYMNSSRTIKEFIQIKLIKHSLFKDNEFWKKFLIYSIESALHEMNKDIAYNQQMIQNVYMGQLVAVVNNMLEIEMEKNVIYSIINEMKEKYDIDMNIMNIVMKLIDEKEDARGNVMKRKENTKKDTKKGGSVGLRRISNRMKERFGMEYNE